MSIRTLRPARPMDSLTRRFARAAVERLSQGPVTEGTVLLRLGAMPRRQYRALCALVGGDSPHEVMDFALRVTGVRVGRRSAHQRLAELNRES